MSGVLDWIKSNVFTVVFVVLMIAALVAMPIVSSKMNASVRDEVAARGRKFGELTKLEKTPVSPPSVGGGGEPRNVLVNQKLLDRYEEVVTALKDDAEQVRAAALAHNRKQHDVVMSSMFPAPPPAQAQVLPQQFHERLIEAYLTLLDEVGAGTPPSAVDIAAIIQRRQAQFITQIAAKDSPEDLTEDERQQLIDVLTAERVLQYTTAAEDVGMYVMEDALNVPGWDPGRLPSVSELFNWQWKLWITQDVLRALSDANGDADSVSKAVVKRVLWVDPIGMPQPAAAPTGGRSGGGRGSFGGGGRGGNTGGRGGVKPGGAPARPAGPDYSNSFTGRKSNALYDVILVDLQLLVESTRIPAVLDALAKYNFMTILDVQVTPTEPYGDLDDGFFYGAAPLSEVRIRLETVWLREWTTPFMPDDLKRGLGMPVKDDTAESNTPGR